MAEDLLEEPLSEDRVILAPEIRGIKIDPPREAEDLRMYDLMQGVKTSDDPEYQKVGKFLLQDYKERREAEGEPAFKYLESAQAKEQGKQWRVQMPFFGKLFSGPANFATAYPEEQRPGIDERFANSMRPDDDKRQTANMIFVQAMTGEEPDSETWATQRTNYAKAALGWQGEVIDDATLYGLIGKKVTEQQQESDMAEHIAGKVQGAVMAGKSYKEAIAEAKTMTHDWERYEPAAKQAAASVLVDYSDAELGVIRPLFEQAAKIEGTAVTDSYQGSAADALAFYAQADQKQRDKIMTGIGQMAQAEGTSVEAYFARVANAYKNDIQRVAGGLLAGDLRSDAEAIDELLKGGVMPGETAGTSPLSQENADFAITARMLESRRAEKSDAPTRPMTAEEKKQATQARDQIEGLRLFIMDAQTAGIRVQKDLDTKRDGFWDTIADTSVMMAGSVPTMSMAALPYGAGLPAVARGYYEQSLSEMRRLSPNASEQDLSPYAAASAFTQTAVDRFQISLLGAKAANLQAAMFKWGRPGVVMDAALRSAGIAAAETGTEVAQDLSDSVWQDIGSALNKDIKGVQWDEVIAREKAALGDIALVSAGFAVIFGVGGSVTDYMDAKQVGAMLGDRKALELAGFDAAQAKEVSQLSQKNPAAAAKTLQAMAQDTPVETRKANSEAARAAMEAEQPVDAKAAGIPTLQKLDDGRVQVDYPDRASEIVAGNEAALNAVRNWEDDSSVSLTKANREYVDFLTAKIAETTGGDVALKAETGASIPSLGRMAAESAKATEAAKQRVLIAMRQAGNDMGLDDIDLDSIPILGTSQNSFENGVTTISAKIAKRANPLTVIEETAEGVGKWLLASANVGESKMVGWIRDTEQKTGQQILSPGYATMDQAAKVQEIVEAWSYLVQANAMGKVADSSLPSPVKAFFRAFKEFISNALRIAADFARVRGDLDPEFTYWLDVSSGVNEETQAQRFENEVNAELAGQTFSIQLPGDALSKAIAERVKDPEAKAKTFKTMARLLKPVRSRALVGRPRPDGITETEREQRLEALDANREMEMDRHAEALAALAARKKNAAEIGDKAASKKATEDRKTEAERHKKAMEGFVKERDLIRKGRAQGKAYESREDAALEKFEQIRDIATLEAIIKALPVSARGSLQANFRKLADIKTPEARQNYILSLIPKVETVLETYLQKQFREQIRKILKKGDVKVSDAKTRGGKISPHGHDVFAMAKRAMTMDAEKADAETEALTNQIESAESLGIEQLDELDAKRAALELFYDYENADAARLERAAEFLTETYQEGRKEWLAVLGGRRVLRDYRIETIRSGLGVAQVRRGDRSQKKQEARGTLSALNESMMAAALSGSQTIRRLGELTDNPEVRSVVDEMEQAFADAEALESDLNAADQQAFKLALRSILGTSTEYGTAKKLRELSDTSKDAPVTTIEGRKTETVSIPIEFAEALVEGEVSGFDRKNGSREELDADDIAALSEEWERFQDLTEKEQAKQRVIPIQRKIASGERLGIGKWSPLEGLQLWLTMRQPDQAAKLEKMGYDAKTMEELERWLPDDVKALGEWMVNKIGEDAFTVDQLHRAEKGVGLSLVDQYFPVKNDVSRADNSGLSLDGSPPQQSGRSVGFIKERVSNQAEPAQVNALSVFLGHRAQSNFWRSHVTPMREWGGIVKDERFADAVKAKMGEKYYTALDTLMKRIESGGRLAAKQADDFDRLVKGLTRRFALGTLGMRMSTLIVNTTAALNSLYKVPAPKLIKGMMQAMKRPESFKDAWNSPAIKRRIRDGSTFEAVLAGQRGPTTQPIVALMESIAQQGVKPINYVDTAANMLGAVSVWEYTRTESERVGMSPEEAKAAADRAVDSVMRQAAQPTSRLSRSEFELATAENPARGLIALFISEPRKNFAITYQAIRELATGKGTEGKGMAVQQAAVGLLLMAAAENIARSFYQALANAKDDEEDEVWERFTTRMSDPKAWGYKMTTQYLQNIPLLGEGWNQFMGWAWDQKTFENQNPLNRAVSSVVPLVNEIKEDGEATTEEVIEGAIKAAQGVGSTVPGGPLVSQIANVADFVEGVVETDEEEIDRYAGRYRKFSKELTESIGTDEAAKGNKEKKDRMKADWLKGEITPLPEPERKKVLEKIDPSADVRKLVK